MPYAIPFEVSSLTYVQALDKLHSALRFGIEPLIETVEEMLHELGDPDHAFASVQVAGTNGKTSTSRYAAALLRGEGLCVGLYTSPELVRYNERMELDGRPVSDHLFARGIAAASVAGERVNARRRVQGLRPYDVTEFDLLTVAACVIFAEADIDVAVLEVGMGGRWDATTAVASIETVAVTGIALDHTRILGDTLEAIAAEKAAVIKAGMRCVLGPGVMVPPRVEEVLLSRCREVGVVPTLVRPDRLEDTAGTVARGKALEHGECPLARFRIGQRPDGLAETLEVEVGTPRSSYQGITALKPAYQASNIALAITLVEEHLGRPLDLDALKASIASCPTPGRFDCLRTEPLIVVDACHNPQSVEVFLGAVREAFPEPERRPTLLAAVLADKDVDGIVSSLARDFPCVCVTQTSSPRALSAHELADRFRVAGTRVMGCYPTVAQALESLSDEPLLACGSITLAGEVAGIVGHPAHP